MKNNNQSVADELSPIYEAATKIEMLSSDSQRRRTLCSPSRGHAFAHSESTGLQREKSVSFDFTERQAVKSSNLRGKTVEKVAEPGKTVFVAPSETNMVRRIAHAQHSTKTYAHHLTHSRMSSAVAWAPHSLPRLKREPALRVVSAVQLASAMSRNTQELTRRG